MACTLFPEERHRASPIYRMNSIHRIFLRFTTSGSESVSTRKHLEILSTIIRSVSKAKKRATKGEQRNFQKWMKTVTETVLSKYMHFRVSPFRRQGDAITSLEARFGFRPTSHVNSIFVGKIKRSALHLFRDTIWLHLHWEIRASERANLGESRIGAIDRTRSTGVVNARHALTPSGCICIQQKKQRCWSPLVHRYAPLGSFSLNIDEGCRNYNFFIFSIEN